MTVVEKPVDIKHVIAEIDGMRFRIEGQRRAVVQSMSRDGIDHIVEVDSHGEFHCTCESSSFGKHDYQCKHVRRFKAWLADKAEAKIVKGDDER